MPRYADADSRLLRVMGHPTRGALLYELFARGEATATELGAAIGEPVNSVSFHLRTLARHDVVEEVARDGDRRQRWWRVPHDGFMFDHDKIRREPGGNAALNGRRRHALAWWRALMERFFLVDHPAAEVWNINDTSLRLTDEEAGELAGELLAVLGRWRRASLDRVGDGATRRTYLGIGVVLPHQPDLGRVRRS